MPRLVAAEALAGYSCNSSSYRLEVHQVEEEVDRVTVWEYSEIVQAIEAAFVGDMRVESLGCGELLETGRWGIAVSQAMSCSLSVDTVDNWHTVELAAAVAAKVAAIRTHAVAQEEGYHQVEEL